MEQNHFLSNALIYFTAALIMVPLMKRLGLGSILGYLIAGILIGPWFLKLITEYESILHFSELGVVFFMFVIGLELNPRRLWIMRRSVFGLGGFQVALTTAVITAVGLFLGLSWLTSLVVAFALSLSSTAFTLQTLTERNLMNTELGRHTFSILLFQDIAVIPALALVPVLGDSTVTLSGGQWMAALQVIGILVALVLGARLLLRPFFRFVAQVRLREIFTAAGLFLVIGFAMIMNQLGLSMALGSFLAGILLADSEYRHELEADIEPFKGLLLGLFFISVGMSINFGLFLSQPFQVLGFTALLLLAKFLVLFFVGKSAGLEFEAAKNLGFAMPQGSEFAFVLFAVASKSHIISPELMDLLIVVVSLSMGLTPFLYVLNEKFCSGDCNPAPKSFDQIESHQNPIIIAGFGRFGQMIGRILSAQKIGFVALEQDSEQVEGLRKFGHKVYYGDASRIDLLELAGAAHAKVIVLAIDTEEGSLRTVEVIQKHFPNLRIFARARNRGHASKLLEAGVEVIHRETFAASMEMALDTLKILGFEESKAKDIIQKFRAHDEKMIRESLKFREDEAQLINYAKQSTKQLAELFAADQPTT